MLTPPQKKVKLKCWGNCFCLVIRYFEMMMNSFLRNDLFIPQSKTNKILCQLTSLGSLFYCSLKVFFLFYDFFHDFCLHLFCLQVSYILHLNWQICFFINGVICCCLLFFTSILILIPHIEFIKTRLECEFCFSFL